MKAIAQLKSSLTHMATPKSTAAAGWAVPLDAFADAMDPETGAH